MDKLLIDNKYNYICIKLDTENVGQISDILLNVGQMLDIKSYIYGTENNI